MDIWLLNVMGSAAMASAIVVGIMTQRLSRNMAGSKPLSYEQPAEARKRSRLMFWRR
jgi:hypothetical protein